MKQQEQLAFIHSTKTPKIGNYPFYPIAHAISEENGISYLFKLNFSPEQQTLSIIPLTSTGEQLMIVNVDISVLPLKPISILYVLSLKSTVLKHTIELQSIDFMVGFRVGGQLVRLRAVRKKQAKEAKLVQRYNVYGGQKEGVLTRMSNKLFSSQQFYRTWIQSHVRNFERHTSEGQKYNYSYLIGNTIVFLKQLSSESDLALQKQYRKIKWVQIKQGMTRIEKSIILKNKLFRAFMTGNYMIIQYYQEICSYVYIDASSLAIANNSQSRITIYDINDMKELRVFGFDIQIKKINFFSNYMLVMPYENSLYIVDIKKQQSAKLIGHKSFITNAVITKDDNIVTGGCDHRISFQSIEKIKNWQELGKMKRENEKEIKTSCSGNKFESMYFLGKFNNVRNNEYDYGFGNFMVLANNFYAYLTYDFQIKIFRVNK